MSKSKLFFKQKGSVIDFKSTDKEPIYQFLLEVSQLKTQFNSNKNISFNEAIEGQRQPLQVPKNRTAAFLFLEPSTRTRFSFESAAAFENIHPLIFDSRGGTSLEKGESFLDTFLNLEALKPLFFVVRAPDDFPLHQISEEIQTPLLNAGWGMKGHPTQALLDVFTLLDNAVKNQNDFAQNQSDQNKSDHIFDFNLQQVENRLKNKKVLFVGDVKHSRVMSSHLELSPILGYSVGVCGPDEFLERDFPSVVQKFSNLKSGAEWADALVFLRVQKERHQSQKELNLEIYRRQFALTKQNLHIVKPQSIIMHPGPINFGLEIDREIMKDPRQKILDMVTNGLFVRQKLIQNIIYDCRRDNFESKGELL